jgi:hypothetical protein
VNPQMQGINRNPTPNPDQFAEDQISAIYTIP